MNNFNFYRPTALRPWSRATQIQAYSYMYKRTFSSM